MPHRQPFPPGTKDGNVCSCSVPPTPWLQPRTRGVSDKAGIMGKGVVGKEVLIQAYDNGDRQPRTILPAIWCPQFRRTGALTCSMPLRCQPQGPCPGPW